MTTFTDRRCTAVADTSEAETERMRRRRDVREKAFRLQLEKDKIGPLEAVLTDSFARTEAATDAHAATCGPLQTELESLEAAAVLRIQQRQSPDKIADARRIAILHEIAIANAELEGVVESEKQFRAPTEGEIWRLRNQVTDPSVILHKLGQPPLASPSIMIQLHCAKQSSRFALARLENGRRALKVHEGNVDGLRRGVISGDLAIESYHVACWQAEVDAAGEAVAAALAEADRLHRAMIDE